MRPGGSRFGFSVEKPGFEPEVRQCPAELAKRRRIVYILSLPPGRDRVGLIFDPIV